MTARVRDLGTLVLSASLVVGLCPQAALASAPTGVDVVGPLAVGVVGPIALAQPSDDDMTAARASYKDGEKAYRLGDFESAALAFEKAYELSGLPDILYNIGLSHLRWYDTDPDVAHLRKAKVVFQNYQIEIQKNPELGDADEAEALIKQIDEKLDAHARAEAEAEAAAANNANTSQPIDLGPDPGKKLRLGGAIAMGVGGAFVVGGTVSGVILGVRGQEFEENLGNAYQEREDLGCTTNDDRPACVDVENEIDTLRNNGRQANALAVGLGLTLGGVGVIGLVTGAVLFVQGNKKTKSWEARSLGIAPTFGGGTTGLVISGKF